LCLFMKSLILSGFSHFLVLWFVLVYEKLPVHHAVQAVKSVQHGRHHQTE